MTREEIKQARTVAHAARLKSRIREAVGYYECDTCGALRGDPCRTGRGMTTKPHAGRPHDDSTTPTGDTK